MSSPSPKLTRRPRRAPTYITSLAPRLLALGRIVLTSTSLAACGSDSTTGSSSPEPVASVLFARSADTIVLGATRTLTITLRDAGNRLVSPREVAWSSSEPAVATVAAARSQSGADGIAAIAVHSTALGTTTLTAASEGQTASISIAVVPAPVHSVQLQHPATPFFPGDTGTITATALDSVGQPLDGRTAGWVLWPATVATISPSGRVTVLDTGSITITATIEGVTGSTTLSITGERVANIELLPRELALGPGERLPLRTRLTSATGNALRDRAPGFRSSNPAVATVSADGVVTTVAPGYTVISASSGGQSASLPITVHAPAPSAFTIGVRLIGMQDPAVEAAARQAAARWSRVITGALPPVRVDFGDNQCAIGAPAIHETISNLTVFVAVDSIDGPGSVLAYAGPCAIRQTGAMLPAGYPEWGLPVLGAVFLDHADLAAMQSSGMLADVILHEMGHVLGIGTLWNIYGQRLFVPPATHGDPRHIGLHTATVAYRLGFTDDPLAGAQVEAEGGGGTAGAHWREGIMQAELMTGWISSGRNPLSSLTVETLRDLGYEVDPAGADAFSVSNTFVEGFPPPPNLRLGTNARRVGGTSQAATTAPTPIPLTERLLVPRFGVDRRGRTTPLAPPR
jgi:hypothetical protein